MNSVSQLYRRIESLSPEIEPGELARLFVVFCNHVGDISTLGSDAELRQAWRDASIKLQASVDQHAAVVEDLESLTQTDPRQFQAEQIWVLIRAIKVQSQILSLYLGTPALDV